MWVEGDKGVGGKRIRVWVEEGKGVGVKRMRER